MVSIAAGVDERLVGLLADLLSAQARVDGAGSVGSASRSMSGGNGGASRERGAATAGGGVGGGATDGAGGAGGAGPSGSTGSCTWHSEGGGASSSV